MMHVSRPPGAVRSRASVPTSSAIEFPLPQADPTVATRGHQVAKDCSRSVHLVLTDEVDTDHDSPAMLDLKGSLAR